MARRRRKALGSSERTHTRLARDYLRRAKNDFEYAHQQQDCRPTLGRLFDAHGNFARAIEHTVASGAQPTEAMTAFGLKIYAAISDFADGPCMRRTPYDKG